MRIDSLKELIPVIYYNMPIKYSKYRLGKNSDCFYEHWHDRMELIFVISGEMNIVVNGNEYTLKEGMSGVFSPGDRHSGRTKDGVCYIVLAFDLQKFLNGVAASKTLIDGIIKSEITLFKAVDDKEIFSLAMEIEHCVLTAEKSSAVITVGCVYKMLGLLYAKYSEESKPVVSGNRFSGVLEYIEDNFSEDISTSSLSRMFGFDEAYFCRRFKAETGQTVVAYIRILRLEKSLELLEKGNSVADSAAVCGFGSTIYFSRLFKKRYGITPSEYAKSRGR